ncbi:MAG: preprotein translocase subunit YajC [Planctomycetota bacterium]
MNLYPYLYFLQAGSGSGGDVPPEVAPTGGGSQFLIVMFGMILIFYFLLIRPQMKEQKRRKEMLSSIKKHDRVITSGGIYGVVVAVGDADVTLKIDDSTNVRVKFSRAAISTILRDEEPEEKK